MSEANNGGRGDRAMATGRAKDEANVKDEAAVGRLGWSRLLLLASYLGRGLAVGRMGTHGRPVGRWVDLASYFLPLTWG